jgi:hypothetical protein
MAGSRVVVASQISPGASSSRDSRQHSAGLNLEANDF